MRKTLLTLTIVLIGVGLYGNVAEAKYNQQFRWPTTAHIVTTTFHDDNYIFKKFFEHSGIDLAQPQGAPVYAAKDGVVIVKHIDDSTNYAYVMLVHKKNFSSVYGEMNQIVVEEGQAVKRGDLIGYSGGLPGTVGAGAYSTGPHLHFEIRKSGMPVNPTKYLKNK